MRRSMPSHTIFTCTGGAPLRRRAAPPRPRRRRLRAAIACSSLLISFGVGRLLRGLQRDRVELRDGPVQRGHRRRARRRRSAAASCHRASSVAPLDCRKSSPPIMCSCPLASSFTQTCGRSSLSCSRIGDPLAVGRILRAGDVAGIALRHDIGLPAIHIHHAQLVVAAAPQQASWNRAPTRCRSYRNRRR